MSTNYYIKGGKGCPNCRGTGKADLHIGKKSQGWPFVLNPFFQSLREWSDAIATGKVVDEYSRPVDNQAMFAIIEVDKDISVKEYSDDFFRDEDGYLFSKAKEFS